MKESFTLILDLGEDFGNRSVAVRHQMRLIHIQKRSEKSKETSGDKNFFIMTFSWEKRLYRTCKKESLLVQFKKCSLINFSQMLHFTPKLFAAC